MAAIFLYQSVGPAGTVVLCVGSLAVFVAVRWYRSRNASPASQVVCLTCGEALASTARECRYCGSARWTWKN
jgi:ribosomal protein L40E